LVGVLQDYKGVDVLAEAWRLAAPRVPDAELRIFGQGPKSTIVEEVMAELPRQARWYPALEQKDLLREFDSATALVLSSRSEGLPRIVLESFCRGRPVIAARAGGVVDLVRDGENGLLVEPEDPEALADALGDLLLDPAWGRTPLGRRGAERERLARDAGGVCGARARPRRLPRLTMCAPNVPSSS
jgi:glycosyltransferase involved in cell wall biosynthesis